MNPEALSTLLNTSHDEHLDKEQRERPARSIRQIEQVRKGQVGSSPSGDLSLTKKEKTDLIKRFKIEAQKEGKIPERDIGDDRYFFTPTPAYKTLPVALADKKGEEIRKIFALYHTKGEEDRENWLMLALHGLKDVPNRVAKLQQSVGQHASGTASSSGASEKPKFRKFKNDRKKKAAQDRKVLDESYGLFHYFFTPKGPSYSMAIETWKKNFEELEKLKKEYHAVDDPEGHFKKCFKSIAAAALRRETAKKSTSRPIFGGSPQPYAMQGQRKRSRNKKGPAQTEKVSGENPSVNFDVP